MSRKRSLAKLFILILTLALLCIQILAQSGRRLPNKVNNNGNGSGDDSVKLGTLEVMLPVTVRNAYGHLAKGLSRRDFIIIEDEQQQEIASFRVEKAPINIVLLLDASGSVFTEISSIRTAALNFVNQLSEEDRACVIQFADKVELIQDWTNDKAALRKTMMWRYRPGEYTHFYDALYLAAAQQLKNVNGRKAIIVMSDGVDTRSKVKFDQAMQAIVQSQATVYVVSKARAAIEQLRKYGGIVGAIAGTRPIARAYIKEFEDAEQNMREMAERTGGRIYSPLADSELNDAYQQVADELRSQYILTYVPKNDRADGSLRRVRILITQPGYTAYTRSEYYAPKN